MPTAIREQLLDAITTAVGGQYGVDAPQSEQDCPLTVVQDAPDEAEGSVYGQTNLLMPVGIGKGAVASSSDLATMRAEAHAMMAEIITEMYTDETFGGLADGLDITGCGIDTGVGKFVFATVSFTVRYNIAHGDPFTSE